MDGGDRGTHTGREDTILRRNGGTGRRRSDDRRRAWGAGGRLVRTAATLAASPAARSHITGNPQRDTASYHRVLRVARTLADLEAAARVARIHIAEAVFYRRVALQR
ncbi:MAG: hypothetical protein HYR63_09615 [Proteobacteria bacterium]|nr:hypothetical protein [Pseudomonadota bacterium]